MNKITLLVPSARYAAQLEEYKLEFLNHGENLAGGAYLELASSIDEWLQTIADDTREETVRPGLVPATTLLAVRTADDRLVGMVNIRHRLNEWLLQYGGHIGYSVRRSERRQGYAKEMLRQAVGRCCRMGITRILVTCDRENAASAATIRANGGVLENEIPDGERTKQRYWISAADWSNKETPMDGTRRKAIIPGTRVSIVLKQDQRTGRLTEGVVRDLLTKSPTHPHGIKVRLEDGQVGRVKAIHPD